FFIPAPKRTYLRRGESRDGASAEISPARADSTNAVDVQPIGDDSTHHSELSLPSVRLLHGSSSTGSFTSNSRRNQL
ncbi:hypothetical protein V5799_024750, partial [Amblyomma americanum]